MNLQEAFREASESYKAMRDVVAQELKEPTGEINVESMISTMGKVLDTKAKIVACNILEAIKERCYIK